MTYIPGGGSGAPTDATYITQTAHGSLSAEQALAALTTGVVKVTTTTGVLSTAAAGVDYAAASHTHAQADVTNLVTDLAAKVVGDDTSTTAQNIVAYSGTGGLNVTELTGTQGDILYHNGTLWSKLAAGTSGYGLITGGPAANPSWSQHTQAAAQADQETATSTTTYVSPGRQQFHPSAAKFWIIAAGDGSSNKASYNVSGIGDTGPGDLQVQIGTDFSTVNYCVVASVERNNSTTTVTNAKSVVIKSATLALGTVSLQCWDASATNNVIEDPSNYFCVGFGDQ